MLLRVEEINNRLQVGQYLLAVFYDKSQVRSVWERTLSMARGCNEL